MVEPTCGHQENQSCKVLDQLTHDTEAMTTKVFEGFLKHRRGALQEAAAIGQQVDKEAKLLTQAIITATEQSKAPVSTTFIEVVSQLQKIRFSVDKIGEVVGTKIDEAVLFSDKAVLELKDYFNAVLAGLHNLHDLIMTNNPVLIEHIINSAASYEEIGRRYAEEHQDRLIKGICLPKSSLIYLLALESLKDIMRYLKTAAMAFKENK